MPAQMHIENIAAVTGCFDAMLKNIQQMPTVVPAEFAAWQTEDVNRKQASVMAEGASAWSTIFRPRGLKVYVRKTSRHSPSQPPRTTVRRSTRPILRPELFDQLVARMAALMLATLRWR
jgi:hypothetical protein